jgi:hypothetical protein
MVGSDKVSKHKLGWVLVAIVVAMVWGLASTIESVDVKVEGSTHTYTYLWWIPTLILLGGLVSVSSGLALRRRPNAPLTFALLVVLPFAAFTFGPSMYFDRWVVGDKQLSVRTGFWGMRTFNDIVYDDLASVRYYALSNLGRRGGGATYYLVCTDHDGTVARVPLESACSKPAAAEILNRIAARRIPIHDEIHGTQ